MGDNTHAITNVLLFQGRGLKKNKRINLAQSTQTYKYMLQVWAAARSYKPEL